MNKSISQQSLNPIRTALDAQQVWLVRGLLQTLIVLGLLYVFSPSGWWQLYLGSLWLWLLAMPATALIISLRSVLMTTWRVLLVRAPRRRQRRFQPQAIRTKRSLNRTRIDIRAA